MKFNLSGSLFPSKNALTPIVMRFLTLLVILSLMSFNTYSTYSQHSKIVISKTQNLSVEEIFDTIENQTDLNFIYPSGIFEDSPKVLVQKGTTTVGELLKLGLSQSKIEYAFTPEGNILLKPLPSSLSTEKEKAYQNIINGTVNDENGLPLPGVNIIVKNTDRGTQTDFEGNYSIPAEKGETLVFSFLGLRTHEVLIDEDNQINVQLENDTGSLDEVMVVAYGTVNRGETTSAIAHIDAEDFSDRPISNVTSALEGAAPGIQTTTASGQPGEASAVRIRGFGSINASSNPLYVVDGAVYEGGLSNFNMDDIASISVLKDAASTALYGSRGANGVIIITTKTGKNNRDGISLKASHGFVSRAIPEYDRVDAFEYYPMMWQSFRNSLLSSGEDLEAANQQASEEIVTQLGYNPFNVEDNNVVRPDGTLNPDAQLLWADDLDWIDEIQRLGTREEYSISYNGGGENSTYYGSLGYVGEEGFIINSHQERFTGRLNFTTQPLKWIKSGINLAGTMAESNNARVAASTRIDNPFYFTRTIGPIYPVYAHDPQTGDYLLDETGNRFYDYGNFLSLGLPFRPDAALAGKHIAEETKLNKDSNDRIFVSGRTFFDFLLTDDLTFTTNLSFDLTNSYLNTYGNNLIGNDAPAGMASKSSYRSRSFTFNQLLEYNKNFGKHNFSLLAGHENYDLNIQYVLAERQGQIVADNYELNNFATITDATSYADNHRIESYLSRLNYDFDGKYFLSGSFRRDGNSRFKREYRWDNFYSVGLAWRLDREGFAEDANWLDLLKVRGSYGKVGNDAGLGYYPYQALYALGFNNASEPGIRQSSLPNDNITWEGQKTTDVAVEFGTFDNRLNGTIEYYHRNSDDLIFAVQLPLSLGGYFLQQNIGAMVNEGLEVNLNGDIIRNEDFIWNLGINFSTLKNEITRMPPDQPEIISGTKKLAVGHSIYDYWVREWQGVDPETGSGLYTAEEFNEADSFVRTAGDTVTTNQNNAKFVYAGSAIPDLFGSVNTRFSYKGFDLSTLFTFQVGGLIYDQTYASLMHSGNFGAALHIDAQDAWQETGDITNVPRLENGLPNPTSSRWLTDASYLNIRNATLGYNFPSTILSKFGAQSSRIFVSGENLHWFSERKGMNVQQSFTGVTSNAYIPSRTISIGLNLNF